MKNKEVYEFSKVLVKTLVECNSDKKAVRNVQAL